MKLIKNINVYAPEHLGNKDVLIIGDKIAKIEEAGCMPEIPYLTAEDIIDGSGKILTPGFIDCHVHILGGGGEGGFANRTPEATVEGLTKFGVTTVVGCLGTDGIGRDMCALVAKTKGLCEQGMSAYCYTGSYQIPVHTLTDSITKDIMMIQETEKSPFPIIVLPSRRLKNSFVWWQIRDWAAFFQEKQVLSMCISGTVRDAWI